MELFLELIGMTMVPVVVSVILYVLERYTKYGDSPKWFQTILAGVLFGGVAIFGTLYGVDVGGALANVRDAGPLCAGLLFGGPSGIIAGTIGGLFRAFCAGGDYSRVACSLSTFLAGIFAAFLRKHMFDGKRPSWGFGLVAGVIMEALHLTLLFVTKIKDAERAYEIIKIVTVPMISCVALGVALSCVALSLLSYKKRSNGEKQIKHIADRVQMSLLICIVAAYLATTTFVYILQTGTLKNKAEDLLETNVEELLYQLYENKQLGKGSIQNIRSTAEKRHIGNSGYIILAKDGEILTDREGQYVSTLAKAGFTDEEMDEARYSIQEKNIFGEDCFYVTGSFGEIDVIAVYTLEEAYSTRDDSIYINSFMEILVFAVLFFMIYALVKHHVVDNIQTVNEGLSKIMGGNLDITVNVRSSAEFASLSDDINSTVTTLKHYIDEAAARIDRELLFAKNIQLSALPSVFPAYPNIDSFDIYATMNTAKEVGGDFYDFYMLGDNKIAFLIADVSGKGIPAAMFMMKAKTLIKNLAESGLPANEVFTRANEELCNGNEAGMFVTAWMGILNLETGVVQFVNAGHNPPLVCRDGKFEYLKSRAGLVLAGMEGFIYREQELTLNPGDRIYLYTDGVTEATNCSNELFGEERLITLLNENKDMNVSKLLPAVFASVNEFAGEAEQFDDITMVGVDYFGQKSTGIKLNERVFAAKDSELDNVNAFIEEELEKDDCPMKAVMQLTVALEEIFVNVAHYAYLGGEGNVTVGISAQDGCAVIRFTDSGKPFNPLDKEDPDITLSADDRKIGGLGIYMVKKTMDNVEYSYLEGHNILTITKKYR